MPKSKRIRFSFIAFLFVSLFAIVGCRFSNSSDYSVQTSTSNYVDSQSSEQLNTDFKYQIYLLAVESGYEGTYEEWINSIKGSDGKNGENGVDGREVVLIVENGIIKWKYADEDNSKWRVLISLNELAGVDGKDGTNGKDGVDGLTPHIGENGNWYIGDEDTGIASVVVTENMDRIGTDGLYFDLTIRNGIAGYEVVGYSGTDLDIVIPNKIFGQKVVSIKQGALPTSITSLSISEHTETLPTFQSYSNLKSFDFNNATLKILLDNSFKDAVNLSTITNYSNLQTIGAYSFYNTLILSNDINFVNIVNIGDYAFYSNSNTNMSIEYLLFFLEGGKYKVADETFIYLPETVKTIGYRAFPDKFSVYYGGSSEVTFSSQLFFKNVKKTADNYWYVDRSTYVGLLNYTGNLKELTIPSKLDGKNVNIVENYAFIGDNNLTRINLPSSITSIGTYSFMYTRKLYVLHIPSSIVNISANIFASWVGYEYEEALLEFPAAVVVFENEQTDMILVNNSVSSYRWGRYAFGYTSSQILQDNHFVYVEKALKMEILAIKNASGKVTIPSSYLSKPVSRINQYSLIGYNGGVTFVEISNGVEYISTHAFYGSEILRFVTIPLSVNAVNYLGFYVLKNAEIHVKAGQKPSNWDSTWCNEIYGVVWNSQMEGVYLTESGTFIYSISQNEAKILKYIGIWNSSRPIIIPSETDGYAITSLAKGAISYTSSSTTLSIVIPSSVTTIENEAILYYRNLTIYSTHTSKPIGWLTAFGRSYYWNNYSDTYRSYYWLGSWSLIDNIPTPN